MTEQPKRAIISSHEAIEKYKTYDKPENTNLLRSRGTDKRLSIQRRSRRRCYTCGRSKSPSVRSARWSWTWCSTGGHRSTISSHFPSHYRSDQATCTYQIWKQSSENVPNHSLTITSGKIWIRWIMYSRGRVWVHHLSLSSGHCWNGDWWWWPSPITSLAVTGLVFYCLFMYGNEWQEKKPLLTVTEYDTISHWQSLATENFCQ